MARIRVSFSTALFALSFVICLLVALLFVDRSRQEAEENALAPKSAANANSTTNTQASALVGSSAMSPTPLEHGTSTTAEPPKLVLSAGVMTGPETPAVATPAELPLDPRVNATQPVAAASPTPPLTAAQRAALSPEALSRQLQGKLTVPNRIAGAVPTLAVPEGVAYRTPAPTPKPTRYNAAARRTPLPIVTNGGGVAEAMKQVGPNSAYSGSGGYSPLGKDPTLPFSQQGLVSTQRLRDALATNAGLDPQTLLPVDTPVAAAATLTPATNSEGGWQPTSSAPVPQVATPTPDTRFIVRGQDSRKSAPATASAAGTTLMPPPEEAASLSGAPAGNSAAGALPPPPVGTDPLSGLQSNVPAEPSPTPNFDTFGAPAAPSANSAAAAIAAKYHLPPPPSLPGAAVKSDTPGTNKLDTSKLTQPPGENSKPTPDGSTPGPSSQDTASPLSDLPLDVAAKVGLLDSVPAARVNSHTLTGKEAEHRADAMAALQGKTLDLDTRHLIAHKAAEDWADMMVLADEARRQGLSITDDEANEIARKTPRMHADEWKSAMKKAGFTDAEIQAEMRDMALGEKLVQALVARNYDDTKLQEIYQKSPETFQPARRLHVAEIYKKRPTDAKAAADVERDLQKLQRQAASGADFSLLAMQSSDAPSKAKGGDLGWLDDSSNISEDMAKALLPLKSGEVSPVITDAAGFHIYKMQDIDEPKPGFEGARAKLADTVHDTVYSSLLERATATSQVELSHKQKNRRDVAAKPVDKPAKSSRAAKSRTSAPTAKESTDAALAKVFANSPAAASRQSPAVKPNPSPDTDETAGNLLTQSARMRVTTSKSSDNAPASNNSPTSSRMDSDELLKAISGSSPKDTASASTTRKSTSANSSSQKQNTSDDTGSQAGSVPEGFGNSTDNALPSTPNPATASTAGDRPKNPFSRFLSGFHKPSSTPAQQ